MMIKKNYFQFLALFILITACEKKTIYKEVQVDGESLEVIFNKVEIEVPPYTIKKIIPLETTQNNLLSDDIVVKFSRDFLFVLDDGIKDAIHQFNFDGSYIKEIITVGEGPNQISNIYDFIVTEKNIEILSGKGGASEIINISVESGQITKKIKSEVIGFSFERIDDSYYLYSSYNLPHATYRVSKINQKGELLENYLKNEYSGLMYPMIERNFFKSDDSVYLTESFNNEIYSVTSNGLKRMYNLNFENYNISKDFWENDMMIGFEKLNNHGFYSILSHFESPSLSLTRIVFQKENTSSSFHMIHYKNLGKIVNYKLYQDWHEVYKRPIGIDSSDNIIFSASPFYLLENQEMLKNNSTINLEINNLNEQNNPVIIFTNLNPVD